MCTSLNDLATKVDKKNHNALELATNHSPRDNFTEATSRDQKTYTLVSIPFSFTTAKMCFQMLLNVSRLKI